MDYRRSLDYLYGLQQFGIKLGLDNVQELLRRVGNPQHSLSIVHLAGTNGKGSTACALAALLGSSGLRVGLYTSPHLHSFTERIQIAGTPIPESEVAALTAELKSVAVGIPVTFFEFTTVLALLYFQRRRVDWVVLETGLGGRLDATNVVHPRLCLLTPIALDHQAWLGEGLTAIAMEKAGIMKPSVPVLSARQAPEAMRVVQQHAVRLAAPLRIAGVDWRVTSRSPRSIHFSGRNWRLTDVPQALPGAHQSDNLGLALAAAEQLTEIGCALDPDHFPAALKRLTWPGRIELWQGRGPVLLDGAHNPAGARSLADYLAAEGLDELVLVAAFKADKDCGEILSLLAPFCRSCCIAPLAGQPSVAPREVVDRLQASGLPADIFASVAEALRAALESPGSEKGVLVAGSLFLVAEARTELCRADHHVLTVSSDC